MKNSIPLCFFPTRKILLDDDNTFLESILLKMHGKNFSAINIVCEALNYFTQEYKPKINKNNLIDFNSIASEHTLNIQFKNLHANILENTPEDISILFIDYHMPDMCGIDFIKKISNLPMKKVLITGENDYKIATDAFNDRLIDAYIRKGDPDFLIKLEKITSELEWKYFTDLSQLVYELPEFNYLKNNHLIEFFEKFIDDNDIQYFHLIDKQGTFYTCNAAGMEEYFILKTITQLQQLSKFAEEDGASKKIVDDLAYGKTIPFFNFKESWEIPASHWHSYLYSAQALPTDPSFFWATVKSNINLG